jgi:hypothetical protein
VTISNYAFGPASLSVPVGATVTWTNNDPDGHTATSDAGAFDSGRIGQGGTFSHTFGAAGTYTYHCAFHGSLGMVGTISVPAKASPSSGVVGTVFTIQVASANATGTLVYDIQRKVPGGSFVNWMTGITASRARFDSTGMATGTYSFRSRVRDTSTSKTTGFSAAISVSVSP